MRRGQQGGCHRVDRVAHTVPQPADPSLPHKEPPSRQRTPHQQRGLEPLHQRLHPRAPPGRRPSAHVYMRQGAAPPRRYCYYYYYSLR